MQPMNLARTKLAWGTIALALALSILATLLAIVGARLLGGAVVGERTRVANSPPFPAQLHRHGAKSAAPASNPVYINQVKGFSHYPSGR